LSEPSHEAAEVLTVSKRERNDEPTNTRAQLMLEKDKGPSHTVANNGSATTMAMSSANALFLTVTATSKILSPPSRTKGMSSVRVAPLLEINLPAACVAC
jgi:hypothetical protein